MKDGKIPREVQTLNLLVLSRHLIFILNYYVCDVFSQEDLKRQNRLKRAFQDACFYLVIWHMTGRKFYEISFCPIERFKECCFYLLLSKDIEDPETYLSDDILQQLTMAFNRELEGRLDRGDNFDMFDYSIFSSSVMLIRYVGDYRIKVFDYLAENDEKFNTEVVVTINEDNTLLEEYRKRDQRSLQTQCQHRASPRLSF